jgi:flagellar biosynthesis/type III secretory pathway M-ring protein FliF/YscJ
LTIWFRPPCRASLALFFYCFCVIRWEIICDRRPRQEVEREREIERERERERETDKRRRTRNDQEEEEEEKEEEEEGEEEEEVLDSRGERGKKRFLCFKGYHD